METRELVANLQRGKSRACRESRAAAWRKIGNNIKIQWFSLPVEEVYPNCPQMKLEESAKATIQSNSEAEPEDHYSA
jgi:hypothetical protein